MPTTLVLPEGARPSNLHLAESDQVRMVTSDMYQIADRIREISDKLYIVEVERKTKESTKFGFIIMENCDDGVQRLVFRATKDGFQAKTGAGGLDARVLERLRYLMSVGLHERVEICERDREKWEKEQHEDAMENLWETMGGPMYVEMEKTGFFQRPVSYSPMNRTARRAGRRMAR